MILKIKNSTLAALAAMMFSACSEKENSSTLSKSEVKWEKEAEGKELSKAEYKTWIGSQANPMLFKKKIQDIEYSLRYLPSDYLALREAGKDAKDSLIQQAKKHYSDLIYFEFNISVPDINYEAIKYNLPGGQQKISEYDRRVSYCSFGIQKDISLVTDKGDSIPCSIVQFERSFDVAPVCTFQLAFAQQEMEKVKSEVTYTFHDNLFNKGIIKFSFSKADLTKVPKLTI
ncbi:MAG TPA: hypothetical protein VII99_04010 [Bacteroidia bacterium]